MMAVLNDVFKVRSSVEQMIEIFGCTKEFGDELFRRLREVGDAICEDMGIPHVLAINLGEKTELGPKAQARFDALKRWLVAQHEAYASNTR